MQRQKKEHQKRATIIRRANNMENEEIYSGKNHMRAEDFEEKEWNLMAMGTKMGWKRVGSRNAKLEKNAKKFAENKHPETNDEIAEICNNLDLGDPLGET